MILVLAVKAETQPMLALGQLLFSQQHPSNKANVDGTIASHVDAMLCFLDVDGLPGAILPGVRELRAGWVDACPNVIVARFENLQLVLSGRHLGSKMPQPKSPNPRSSAYRIKMLGGDISSAGNRPPQKNVISAIASKLYPFKGDTPRGGGDVINPAPSRRYHPFAISQSYSANARRWPPVGSLSSVLNQTYGTFLRSLSSVRMAARLVRQAFWCSAPPPKHRVTGTRSRLSLGRRKTCQQIFFVAGRWRRSDSSDRRGCQGDLGPRHRVHRQLGVDLLERESVLGVVLFP